jgi:hypothetical protein
MNFVNRVATVLIILVLWFLVVVIAAAPESALDATRQGLDQAGLGLQRLNAWQPGWLALLARAGVIVGVTLAAIVLLWAELRHKPVSVVKVRAPSGGRASVTAGSVERRLAWHLDQVAGVINARPSIRSRGAAVDVRVDVETAPEVEVPAKTEEIIAVTRDVIETQIGLRLNKVEVQITHAPYQDAS